MSTTRAGWIVVLVAMGNLAAAPRESSLVQAAKQADIAAVRVLLGRHVDVNAAEIDGTTALHWAAQQNVLDLVDMLIRAGANPNATNRYGATPLSLACLKAKPAIVERLLSA